MNEKNSQKICQNPECDNKTNSEHSKYCYRCSIRHFGKLSGYILHDKNLDLGYRKGYVLIRKDLFDKFLIN